MQATLSRLFGVWPPGCERRMAGNATAADVRALIAHVQEVVRQRTGYSLEPEISFVDEF